jgi:competence protein ComEC
MTTPALCAAVGAAVGYYGAAFLPPSALTKGVLVFLTVYAGLIGALKAALVLSAPRKNRARVLFLTSGAIGLFIGLAAGKQSPVRLGLPADRVGAVRGVLRDDSFLTKSRAAGTLTLQRVKGLGEVETSATGEVLAFFPENALSRLKGFGRGCEVYIEGSFTKGGRAFLGRAAYIIKPAPRIERLRTGLRADLVERVSGFAWGGLGLAALFGIKDDLDSTLSRLYQEAGCAHVLALSGMHLAVVSGVLGFLLKRPLGLRTAAVVSAVFIIGYVYLAGDFPSLNRAALMYLIGTVTVLFNFPRDTLSILAMTFILQTAFYKGEGTSASFILSYLALFGILVLGGPIYRFFRGWAPDPLGWGLAVSIAAFLSTAAASAAFFSMLRPIGVVAGLIVVPLTTLFMIGAMVVLTASFLSLQTPLLTGALDFLYWVIGRVVEWASRAPGLPASSTALTLAGTLVLAGLILLADEVKRRRVRKTALIDRERHGRR